MYDKPTKTWSAENQGGEVRCGGPQTFSLRSCWVCRWLHNNRITSLDFFFISSFFLPIFLQTVISFLSPQRLDNLHFTTWFHFTLYAKKCVSTEYLLFFTLDPWPFSHCSSFLPQDSFLSCVPLSHMHCSPISCPVPYPAPT